MRLIAILVLSLLLAFGSCKGKHEVTHTKVDKGKVTQVLVNGRWFEITDRYIETEDENDRVYLYK